MAGFFIGKEIGLPWQRISPSNVLWVTFTPYEQEKVQMIVQ